MNIGRRIRTVDLGIMCMVTILPDQRTEQLVINLEVRETKRQEKTADDLRLIE